MKQELAVVFLLEAYEHARGAAAVYRAAKEATVDRERRRRFEHGAAAVDDDAALLERMTAAMGVRSDHLTAMREIVADATGALVKQITTATAETDAAGAESVALLAVIAAETRSQANLEVLARIGPQLPPAAARIWEGGGSTHEAGGRERMAYARLAWQQLVLRRLEVEAPSARAAGDPTEGRHGAADA